MKLIFFLLITLCYIGFANGFELAENKSMQFKLNPKVGNNELNFTSKAPLEDIFGNVNPEVISSSFTFNPHSFAGLKGYVSFKVSGMQTGISTRDEHLRSNDWLNADKYPEIKFEAISFSDIKTTDKSNGERETVKAVVTGTYSMHGVSKEIKVPVEITFMPESESTRKRAKGDLIFIKGQFKVKLADFKVTGAKGIVGKKVGEEIKVEFNLFYNS